MITVLRFLFGATVMAVVCCLLLGVVLAPLLVPWALNTLFSLGIPLNFWTWLATVVLLGVGTQLFRSK